MDSFKNSLKGYLPVLQNEVEEEVDCELGPSATDLGEPSLISGCCDLTYKQKIVGFAMSAIAGAVFLFLSTFLVGGILIGNVSKFSICYLFANVFFLLSTTFLVGVKEQLKHMMKKKRMILSLVYFSTLFLTMYCVFSHQSMFLILPLIIIQFVSLAMYIVSYLPGGISAINFCSSKLGRYLFRFG